MSLADVAEREGEAGEAAQLFVLIAAGHLRGTSSRHVVANTDLVTIGRGERDARRRSAGGLRRLELRLPDRALSSEHARLTQLRGRWILDDAGSKNGTRVNGTVVRRAPLRDGDLIELGQTFILFRDADTAVPGAPDLLASSLAPPARGLATFSGELARAFAALAIIAAARVPVVIQGDTGTGKEVTARAIHELATRAGAFVAVNCGALPAALVEAQLFGWRKGAYTGAVDDGAGYVRSADDGTLFLDEIAELPAPAQTALLRVLQESEVVPVGGTRPVPVDVRVVAATHQILPAHVEKGTFRRDLWARLAGYVLELPPLSERLVDTGLLINAILERLGAPRDLTITASAARRLLGHHWPLNIRELSMALEAAVALAQGGPIDASHLPPTVRVEAPGDATTIAELSIEDHRLREQLIAALTEHAGNVSATARVMGKGRMQIHRWLRRLGLDLEQFRPG